MFLADQQILLDLIGWFASRNMSSNVRSPTLAKRHTWELTNHFFPDTTIEHLRNKTRKSTRTPNSTWLNRKSCPEPSCEGSPLVFQITRRFQIRKKHENIRVRYIINAPQRFPSKPNQKLLEIDFNCWFYIIEKKTMHTQLIAEKQHLSKN